MRRFKESKIKCNLNSKGPTPDSEKETQGIRNAINAKLGQLVLILLQNNTKYFENFKLIKGKWDLFLTLHSFGQYWMLPWGNFFIYFK